MHNRKQRLTFFLAIKEFIDEDLFFPKIIERLKENLTQKERKAIERRVKSVDLESEFDVELVTLFYCLHVQKPKHGHVSMFTKHLIGKTDIEFKPKFIKNINQEMHRLIERIGLPPLEETSSNFIKNIYYYEPDFIDKYPDLETKINS